MWDESGTPLLQGMPAWVEGVAGDARLGADSVEADGIEPRPDDTAGSPCLDLVMCNSGSSMPVPQVSGCRGFEGSRIEVFDFPQHAAPICHLGADGGYCKAGMFAGCRRG
jgi:hypothetical protein